MGARQCKTGGGVVEGCVRPEHGIMTGCTRGRERSRNMVYRRGRIVVIGLMARYASGGRQIVVVGDVAIRTLPRRHQMRTGEREPGAVVVESCVQPGRRAVARVASLREVRGYVIRIRCALKVGQVASHAGRAIQVVVVVDVAVCTQTRWHRVQAGQREPGAVVVEGRVQPRRCAVARIASLGEVPRHVIRVRCALEIGHMAGNTGCAIQGVVVIHVAVDTLPRRHRVQTGQRETGGRVVKFAIGPQHRVMALLARCGETGVRYRRGRCVEVGLVAADARRVGDGVVVVNVAVRTLARRHHVCSG